MAKRKGKKGPCEDGSPGIGSIGSILGGLGGLLEKLAEFAEKGEEIRRSGEFAAPGGKIRGVYGFSVKVGAGGTEFKVEPFGNVRRDETSGGPIVTEIREPMVDVFDEHDHVLVVAEMPGVGEEDVRVDIEDDILTIAAEKKDTRYRKEVLLPSAFPREKMSYSCRNGILEVRFAK